MKKGKYVVTLQKQEVQISSCQKCKAKINRENIYHISILV